MANPVCVVAVQGVVPDYSSFSRCNKRHKPFSIPNNVAFTLSGRVSSAISFPHAKASPVALEIIRTISEIDDSEVQEELDRLQNAYKRLKNIFGDIIMVLMAINPFSRLLIDAVMSHDKLLRRYYFGALYGVLILLNEFVKILWKSQAFRWYNIIVGFLIYKVNKRNIALHRKGRHAVWLEPLSVVVVGKFYVDALVSVICSAQALVSMICSAHVSVNIHWAFVEAIASFCMALCWVPPHFSPSDLGPFWVVLSGSWFSTHFSRRA